MLSVACTSFERDHPDEKRFQEYTDGSENAEFQRWRRNLSAQQAAAYQLLPEDDEYMYLAVFSILRPQQDGCPLIQRSGDAAGSAAAQVEMTHERGGWGARRLQEKKRKRDSTFSRAAACSSSVLVYPRLKVEERSTLQDFFGPRPAEELQALKAYFQLMGKVPARIEAVKSGALPCGDSMHASADYHGRGPWFSGVILRDEDPDVQDVYGVVQLLAHVFTPSGVSEQVAIVRLMEPRKTRCNETGMLLLRWAGQRPRPQHADVPLRPVGLADSCSPPSVLRPRPPPAFVPCLM